MSKERQPKQIVMYVELEDNVGAVLAKRKIEVPVNPDVDFDSLVQTLTQTAAVTGI